MESSYRSCDIVLLILIQRLFLNTLNQQTTRFGRSSWKCMEFWDGHGYRQMQYKIHPNTEYAAYDAG